MTVNEISNETAHKHLFSTDRQMESREQNLLGRRSFADSITVSFRKRCMYES
jgi:pyruvate/oxaloacetate carboxyltransferase